MAEASRERDAHRRGESDELHAEARADAKLLRCPFCHADLKLRSEDFLACKNCQARHHLSCWHEGGGCSTCRGREFVRVRERSAGPRVSARNVIVAVVWVVALGALLVGLDSSATARNRLVEEGERQRAIFEANRARDATKLHGSELRQRAFTAFYTDRPEEAIADLDGCVSENPTDLGVRTVRAEVAADLEQWAKVRGDTDLLLANSPHDPNTLGLRARALEGTKDFAAAEAIAASLRASSPGSLHAIGVLYRAALRRGQLEPDSLLELNALGSGTKLSRIRSILARGEARLTSGDARGALEDCDRALTLRKDPRAYSLRAEASVVLGNLEGAIRDLELSIRLRPDAALGARLDQLRALARERQPRR